MTELAESLDCVLCQQPFSPVFKPAEDTHVYPIYCDTCTIWIPMKSGNPVRATFQKIMSPQDEPLALAQALEIVLAACPCGGRFRHDAGKRCLDCIRKVDEEIKTPVYGKMPGIWDVDQLREWESKVLAFIMEKLDTREETLTQLIEKFESGQVTPEQYLEGIEEIRYREFSQLAAIQTWAMMQGPDLAFRAAEDLDLVERYGSRILVSIASALEMSTGTSILTSLMREVNNWDGPVQKELKTFIAKTAGGG